MRSEQIKAELANFSRAQRRELISHLLALGRGDDPSFREKLTAKIDDHDPAHWLSEEDLERFQNNCGRSFFTPKGSRKVAGGETPGNPAKSGRTAEGCWNLWL